MRIFYKRRFISALKGRAVICQVGEVRLGGEFEVSCPSLDGELREVYLHTADDESFWLSEGSEFWINHGDDPHFDVLKYAIHLNGFLHVANRFENSPEKTLAALIGGILDYRETLPANQSQKGLPENRLS